jgi:hypothetical protein
VSAIFGTATLMRAAELVAQMHLADRRLRLIDERLEDFAGLRYDSRNFWSSDRSLRPNVFAIRSAARMTFGSTSIAKCVSFFAIASTAGASPDPMSSSRFPNAT